MRRLSGGSGRRCPIGRQTAFAEHGFSALTEIDLPATLQATVGKETERYLIVEACKPKLASPALDAEQKIGVLLP